MNEREVKALIDKAIAQAQRGEGIVVSPYLKDELALAVKAGITDGTRPGGYMLRSEGAVMAYRSILKRYQTMAEVPQEYRAKVQRLIDNGFKGTSRGLDLTEDMIRGIIISKEYNN